MAVRVTLQGRKVGIAVGIFLGIDHGTTRTKAAAFDEQLRLLAVGAADLAASYPRPGWVEQDPLAILDAVETAVGRCLQAAGAHPRDVEAVGLANQGETVVVWERRSGRPVYPAIVWQDRRTAELCERLEREGHGEWVHQRSGVYLDPYFSASKIRWILDHVPDGQRRAEHGEIMAGTTDSWIVWNLSGGSLHVTDPSTASRTLLFNLETLGWDPELLGLFQIPAGLLPEVKPSAGPVGEIRVGSTGSPLPLTGLAVDQQASLFGHACLRPGMVKITYGTGAFILMTLGTEPVLSRRGLVTTVAWQLGAEPASYALDGGIFVAGAAVAWLQEGLGILGSVQESEQLGAEVADSGGVFFVPALAGLGAPHWVPTARGLMVGLTRHTRRGHVVRAVLEGIALRIREVVEAMSREAGVEVEALRVDGGPTRNRLLMQIQADLTGKPVEVAAVTETTALGAAGLAGVGAGRLRPQDVESARRVQARYEPGMAPAVREAYYASWRDALELAVQWGRRHRVPEGGGDVSQGGGGVLQG